MQNLLLILLNAVVVISRGPLKPLWRYDIVSVAVNSSNEDLLRVEMRKDRISRGVYGISGFWDVKFDVTNDTQIECLMYRSATGSLNYKMIPYHVPRQPIFTAINGLYKSLIMKGVKDCSNLPQFKGTWKPPLEKKKYEFHKCTPKVDDMPPYALEGYYKFVFNLYGPVRADAEIVTKVESVII